ncbi:hypothetical protein NDK47_24990 [Brevibacillus ruminantium]|uniref:DUF47 domain-containing protein n=1 Tax=Brevibacillus ruminantium TaxID=2950604 RepID=A0ABY4WDS7_9BACL|nr:hypothetical protein [Brevibacillus ruminantium]USG65325.1 hypothetical protein NDK47_24990 [Brevibacillus ruminantium]
MRLVVSGQEYYFEGKNFEASQIMEKVVEISRLENLVYSHMRIDGVDVYENVEQFIEDHAQTIELVEAIFITISELINDILISTGQYSERAIPELQELFEECYKGPDKDTWVKFGQLVEGIQWLQQTGVFIKENRESVNDCQIQEEIFNFANEVVLLEEAVEQQDFILLGDIIQYEILPKFQLIGNHLKNITSYEVVKHDFN